MVIDGINRGRKIGEMTSDSALVEKVSLAREKLTRELGKQIVGQHGVIEQLLVGLLAGRVG